MSWSPVVEAFMQLEAQRQPSPIFLGFFFTSFFEAKVLEDNSGCVGIEDVMIFLYMVVLSFGYSYPFI